MALSQKHLLSMKNISESEITEILDTAETMKHVINAPSKKSAHLTGKSIITLFYENSTRTRMSFELAAKYMSGSAANISASASSVAKGETLIDTGKTLDQMGTDIIIIRHPMTGAPHFLSKHVNAVVINAGDGTNEHPTQALLDAFTMRENLGSLRGLEVAIVGDVYHSRVARSNLWALQTMGAKVTFCAPSTLMLDGFAQAGAKITTDINQAVKNADVVMGLRIQRERQQGGLFPSVREYNKFYALSQEVIAGAKDKAIIMHPGPMNRGVEINSNVADCAQSKILDQVQNGVAVRMALLYIMSRHA